MGNMEALCDCEKNSVREPSERNPDGEVLQGEQVRK